jgi:hypothetical protein
MVRARSALRKAVRATAPRIAIASTPAVRETALLIPEAVPAYRLGTELNTVVVRGATVTPIPIPNTAMPGKNVHQYSEGPPVSPFSPISMKPSPAMAGPMISGRRGPKRSTSPPAQRDRAVSSRAKGVKANPACDWL